MAKKKRRGPGRPPKQEIEDIESRFTLSSETKQSVVMIILLVVSALMFLSVFNLAGYVGVWIRQVLQLILGQGYGLLPVLIGGIGLLLLNPEKYGLRPTNYIGIVLLVIAFGGLFHVQIPVAESYQAVRLGQGGGAIGWFASYFLLQVMDFWATLLVLSALLIVGIFVGFNISVQEIRHRGAQTISLWTSIKQWLYERAHPEVYEQLLEDESTDEEPVYDDEEAAEDDPTYDDEADDDLEDDEELELDAVVMSEKKPLKDNGARVLVSRKKIPIKLPVKLLEQSSSTPTSGDVDAIKEKIRQTFEQFGIVVEMGTVSIGPTVTQYTFKPSEGVKLARIVALNNDLALALAAHPIRIEAPIPGKSLVGIEVPNKGIAKVSLREVVESRDFKSLDCALPFGLGKDVAGEVWSVGVEKLPHLLIAGATGSGKSVAINSLIVSLLYRNSPDELKFIMVDPKRVELSLYNGIPYLLTPVITDTQKTINALRWVVGEMEQRLQRLSEVGKRNIADYNIAYPDQRMPYIVVIIDELADLMSVAASEVEGAIVRLAQMARAVGIHLVLATQRPSVDVITGLIKANITGRIAFAVASQTDSRTILDMAGAEKLLGRGDMLLVTPELTKPKRLQGAFVSDDEVNRVVRYIKKQVSSVEYIEEVIKPKQSTNLPGEVAADADPLLIEARQIVVKAGKASASYLQRRLRIGYSRAARILDMLEDEGVIGPPDGSRPREVLVTMADLTALTSRGDVDEDFDDDVYDESQSDNDAYEDEALDDASDADDIDVDDDVFETDDDVEDDATEDTDFEEDDEDERVHVS